MKNLILIFEPLKFYSPDDEDLFFEWINKINCIESYKGISTQLELIVSCQPISFNDFLNLNGLFKRYKLKNPEQLEKLFKNENNKDWFKN